MTSHHIRSYLQENGRVSVSILLNSLHHLIRMQQQANSLMNFDKILNAVIICSPEHLPFVDIQVHACLLLESALGTTKPFPGNNAGDLMIRPEVIGNETMFLRSVLEVLQACTYGEPYPAVDHFVAEASPYLESSFREPMCLPPPAHNHARKEHSPRVPVKQAEDFSIALERTNIQKQESICALLAQFRKYGMEILFPQPVYDKVLACVYAVLGVVPSASHQELLEIILTMKQVCLIADIQHTTKTKIRGVVTLLKHSKLLSTYYPADDQPAHLSLAPEIHSLEALRDGLDVFLCNFITEQHIKMPQHIIKQYIIWPKDEMSRASKLSELAEIVQRVEHWMENCWLPNATVSKSITSEQLNIVAGLTHEVRTNNIMGPRRDSLDSITTADSKEWKDNGFDRNMISESSNSKDDSITAGFCDARGGLSILLPSHRTSPSLLFASDAPMNSTSPYSAKPALKPSSYAAFSPVSVIEHQVLQHSTREVPPLPVDHSQRMHTNTHHQLINQGGSPLLLSTSSLNNNCYGRNTNQMIPHDGSTRQIIIEGNQQHQRDAASYHHPGYQGQQYQQKNAILFPSSLFSSRKSHPQPNAYHNNNNDYYTYNNDTQYNTSHPNRQPHFQYASSSSSSDYDDFHYQTNNNNNYNISQKNNNNRSHPPAHQHAYNSNNYSQPQELLPFHHTNHNYVALHSSSHHVPYSSSNANHFF